MAIQFKNVRFNVSKAEMKEILEAEMQRRGMIDAPPDLAESIRQHRSENADTRQQRLEAILTPKPVTE